ncbi:uncharacterized protein EI97DRAFT_119556 [Westerdykella ornata]|uniref:EDC4-like protein pdc1 beta-propeller domain-containing protein n=1 Tax=Westerdykella ornata TaxID=318751 RepID=A0A6A6JUS4_WESOR|nr:uncharacterized protein EI97DRAFT_119556 [Westerdykella ornata]KAF2280332.1 hypothetical protein EI97DRAFT_119556 [Westerdykella ornata]
MSDLQELLARLNSHAGAPAPVAPVAASGNRASFQASVSSPIFTPSPHGAEPRHPSAVLSPNTSAAGTPTREQPGPAHSTPQQQQQSAQLLSLLRFNTQRPSSKPYVPAHERQPHTASTVSDANGQPRQISISEFSASLMGAMSPPAPQAAPAASMPATRSEQATGPSGSSQDLLLRLLNHQKPSQTGSSGPFNAPSTASPQVPETAVEARPEDKPADAIVEPGPSETPRVPSVNSPMRVFGSEEPTQTSSFQPAAPTKPLFTYINPFDQLEAASPRRTPVLRGGNTGGPPEVAGKKEVLKPKHALEGSSNASDEDKGLPHKSRKLSEESTQTPQTVAEAVTSLGPQVKQQVEAALAKAETVSEALASKGPDQASPEATKQQVEASHEPAAEAQTNGRATEDKATIGKDLVKEPKEQGAQESATEEIADNWEAAETDASAAKENDQTVTVFMLPMQPWVSITLENLPQRRATLDAAVIMDIARLKKGFDQIDRSLVAASKNFIVYALVTKGGFRIIRQDDGRFRQFFESHNERIFNISICTPANDSPDAVESILGIGVNGSVFWTSLDPTREDHFSDYLDTHGIVLPPSPTQDDNTSGGQLKTRAKPSSRHPEYFAVGRGKSIHIIWPKVAAEYVRGRGICQTDKYLKERSLRIHTGKAGKDFAFSEDDTVIVSLDKAGRMRFWDIRPLTHPELGLPATPPRQIQVSETLLEFHTTSPAAKSWPTSVFFFDKLAPSTRGIALRYCMVGMKQNHTFQLWDLGLGKAVQEINLPHEKESDAICSVAFHPKTGIMAVAHPTRNSIFFIHVSCPRYNLPSMSQAAYLERLASKNDRSQPPLPPVTATAIMGSFSEYSFAPKGQLRSIYMLNEPIGPEDPENGDNNALFDLYVMHSKGVCTIAVRRSDLGWRKESQPYKPVKASEAGIIAVSPLKHVTPSQEESSNGDTSAAKSTSERSAREAIKKESSSISRQSMTPEAAMRASTLAKVESKQDAARAAIISGGEKADKKRKKRAAAESATSASSNARAATGSYAQAAQTTPPSKSPVPPEPTDASTSAPMSDVLERLEKLIVSQRAAQAPSTAPSAAEFDASKIAELVKAEVTRGLSTEMGTLYKRLDDDRRAQKAASGANQDALLRVVASTLRENVEGVIRAMVEDNMRNVLLPKLLEETSTALNKAISSNLKTMVNAQLAKDIPESVSKALKTPVVMQAFSDSVIKRAVEASFASTGSLVQNATSALSSSLEQKIGDQLRQAQAQRQADAAKITQLSDAVQQLSDTVRSMAGAQAEMLDRLAKLQQQPVQEPRSGAAVQPPSASRAPVQPPHKTAAQLEDETIARLLSEGNFEEGTMKWLQSGRPSEVFASVFANYSPAYLSRVPPLLNLSAGAVVTEDFEDHPMERLEWLEAVLQNVDPLHPEIVDIVPKIMEVMKGRLTSVYIRLNETSPNNPLLRRISALVNVANQLSNAAMGQGRRG